jgi:superfamily II DNA or RNA helicase
VSESLEAAYLVARAPREARIVFYSAAGAEHALKRLPDDVRAELKPQDFQILLPSEESTLRPITIARYKEGVGTGLRVAPALWQITGQALPLDRAVPVLAEMDPRPQEPSLKFLIHAAGLVQAMLQRGDFAHAEDPNVLSFVPRFGLRSLRCLSALAELVPESLLTARFLAGEEPLHVTTPHKLAFSFVSHALDACRVGQEPRYETAQRPPQLFWRRRPSPVLEILVPENELEEGVPWGIQLLFRPVPGLPLSFSLETLKTRLADHLFPEAASTEAAEELEAMLNNVARRIPVFHRAMTMLDGKASLNRQELDTVLDHLPLLEAEHFVVTLPGYEQMQRINAQVSITEDPDGPAGPRPWFLFNWSLALGDRELSEEDLHALARSSSPLVQLPSGPVLLTPKDKEALRAFSKQVAESGTRVSFFEALRLKLGGATHLHGLALETVTSTPRLDELVHNLEQARSVEVRPTPSEFIGEMRPYQTRGHAWIHYLIDQGFGACLADDMGLGKTIQAITVILDWRRQQHQRLPILVVCPVSVLGNWRREFHRFAPDLDVVLHHGKARLRAAEEFAKMNADHDVILTSYSLLQRDEELFQACDYGGIILDEAQNIKNPNTRQSKAARSLRGGFRLVLTGTPLENRPLDLWSIMDFLNEGLLGNKSNFLKTLEHPILRQQSRTKASVLARLVRPFVLRRLKTDPDIITDLPEKTEQVVATGLTREQATLYESIVNEGLEEVELSAEGIQRRGVILTTLLRLKQVCNHPAHYLGDGSALPSRSAKLDLLSEMLEEALAEGDRCLVFTQFKEMGSLLRTHLKELLGEDVLFLHGGVPQKDREDMVQSFQEAGQQNPRIFVLSLKAGGTGLNLTAANRVFHYDRWWNPAVEDQATDRAFRIGQERNVFVHKFVCTGTLEERIQEMLERKREVADSLLGAGEGWITELTNEELRRLLILDRQEALA